MTAPLEQIRRALVCLLGGVVREKVKVEVVPPSLMSGLHLIDGLLASGKTVEAVGQLRVLIIRWRKQP